MATDDPIRYLSAADVAASTPSVGAQLTLAERTLRALDGGADLPAKIGVHPRPAASFGHAMPAWLRGAEPTADLMGIKWVTGFPANRDLGLPAINATLLLSDATTGQLRAILDAGGITACRTAAVSGVVIERWGPGSRAPGAISVGLVGAGVQGASHIRVLAHVLPGCRLLIHDRDAARAEALAADARGLQAFHEVTTTSSAASAVAAADVVVTLISFGPLRQQVPAPAFQRARLVVAVDYDMCVPASVVRDAGLFLVDELGQFLTNRAGPVFAEYPDPDGIVGAWLDRDAPDGRTVVCHLGVGLADVVFGDAILRAAEEQGRGTLLSR